MRIVLLIVVSIVAGLGLGLGSTWARYGHPAGDLLSPADVTPPARRIDPNAPHGKLVLSEEEFNFGPIERDEMVQHDFKFTNAGDGPLELTKGGTSCGKCTIADLGKTRLAPGESTMVTVSYHALTPGDFRHWAVILVTGDPQRERASLNVFGNAASSFRATSNELVLSKFSVNEPKSAEVKLFAYQNDNLEVLKHELLNPETADHFQVTLAKIPADELNEPQAKSGVAVNVTVKPGLPLGPLRQKLRLETNLPRNSVFELPIEGIVDSDLSIIGGKEWNADEAVLSLGSVKSSEGAKRRLMVTIRGPYRNDVKLSVGAKNEPVLGVTLGEPSPLNGGAVIQVPLLIEVPRGAPAINHLGSSQGKLAKVMLETTHPDAKQLQLFVQFAVEND